MHQVFLIGGVAKQLFFERHSRSRPHMWNPAIWRYRSDLADGRAPSFSAASVCSGCLPLWLLSVNPEISTIIPCSSTPLSLLFSSHLSSSLIFPLLSPLPHFYWHVFVLSFHPPPWHLTMEVVAVSGFLFPFFLCWHCLCSSSPWKPKRTQLLSFSCTRHAILSVPSTKCGSVFEAVLICKETETWLDTAICLIYVIVWDTPMNRLSFTSVVKQIAIQD